jgi:hypothetical protein
MKDFEKIGKKMPFAENEEYVRQLVSNATEKAINQPRAKVVALRTWIAAAAAVILLLAGIGITYYNKVAVNDPLVAENTEAPVEQFLNGLTDEEVQLLAYYEIEEIPEYQ